VLSFVYILASVVLLALGSPWAPPKMTLPWFQIWSWLLFALLSLGLGWLPMHLALRRVRAFEL
jgi:hypothetical protein